MRSTAYILLVFSSVILLMAEKYNHSSKAPLK
ncbi:hypothetical protein E2C01_045445 [Portunus trituberculatus]|uniref:Uncharacterized protein n=1 Tax=Portunus trituberculatus TaxID=210409 RepID=A0A5B7G184_PORTR|nr:hypothetical protein [Portunus trituberculatus]